MPLLSDSAIFRCNFTYISFDLESLFCFLERRAFGRENNFLKNQNRISGYSGICTAEAACLPSFHGCNAPESGKTGFAAASLTLEAALCVPVMIFAIYIMIFPLRVLEAERRLQNQMEQTAKYLILYSYAEDVGRDILELEEESEEFFSDIIAGGSEIASIASIMVKAGETGCFRNFYPDPDTSLLSDEDGADPDMIYLKFDYELDLPFSLFNLGSISKSLVTNRRAWTGSAGGRGRSTYSSAGNGEDISGSEDTTVYVGKTSTDVYHLSMECHYLSNNTKTAYASEMASLRNDSGASYHACSSCNPGTDGIVYYFTSGTAYHSSTDCSAISSYVRCISLSEAEGMHVCSYCAAHYG